MEDPKLMVLQKSLSFLLLLLPVTALPGEDRTNLAPPPFESEIQPILAKHCLKCHGSGHAEADLRLTDRDSAVTPLLSGATPLVPGKPDESEILIRMLSTEEGERMPPEGARLSPEEIAKIRNWIAAGADWPMHWAYRPLVATPPPTRESSSTDLESTEVEWSHNPIDFFINEKHRERRLTHAPPADKRTLLRRVTIDLLGMPPTPAELADFLADDKFDAYERVVDRLLKDPRFGERQARHWMDLVHYAETHGHDQDRIRDHVWPYRDYLVQSFNSDKPYSRFVQEQIAGDVLFPGDAAALVATGFLATGPWDESSLRDIREDSIDRTIGQYLDRDDIVTTVISTFASSTIHCARCHDHKFDPITQRDYYGLQAVFSTTDKANRPFDTDPQVAARRKELKSALAALPERVKAADPSLLSADLQTEVAAWERETLTLLDQSQPVEIVDIKTANGTTLKSLDDGSLLATGTGAEAGKFPDVETYTLVVRSRQPAIAALQLDLLTDASLPHQGPGCQPNNGNLHLNEVRLQQIVAPETPPRDLAIASAKADFDQDGGWSIDKSIDGNADSAWGIHPEEGKPHRAIFTLAQPVKQPPEQSGQPQTLRVELQQSHGRGHLIGRFRLSAVSESGLTAPLTDVLVPEFAAILRKPRSERTDDEQRQLTAAFLKPKLERDLASLPPEQIVYCGTNRYEADKSFRPAEKVRPIHILHRGDVNQPREEALPCSLNILPHLPGKIEIRETGDDAGRRAALAQWLSDHRNSIVWRSIVNRLWQNHFGTGIVDTPNDFGRMGGIPTHPELLDWLALELQKNGGSLKHLHRLIVTSAAYRQSSQHDPRNSEIDGENRLLWRMHRSRLDAETVRDAILQTAGTLNPQMGGPSVRQFILSPGAQVTPNLDYLNFDPDDPANYRRSLYRFVFRTVPDPFMDALDCPDSSQLTPTRNASFTPLQALALLHDRVIIRNSERLAATISEKTNDPPSQVRELYRTILLREPRDSELQQLTDYSATHGLANACRLLWNSNEFMFVD